MYKVFLVICAAAMITATCAFAASIGDNVEPLGNMKFAVSAGYDRIFDKDLDGTIENSATTGTFSSGEISSSNQGYGRLAVGITDYLNIYGTLGALDAEFKLNENDGTKYIIDTDTAFLWGGGISGATKELASGFKLGADLQALAYSPDVDKVKYNGETATKVKGDMDVIEVRTALFASRAFDVDLYGKATKLTPYVAGLYNYYKNDTNGNITFNVSSGSIITGADMEADNLFGIAAGTNISITDNLLGNIEGRFISETAFSGSLIYKF